MTEPQVLHLDFLDDDSLAGYRLHRLEVFNWGTFEPARVDAGAGRAQRPAHR